MSLALQSSGDTTTIRGDVTIPARTYGRIRLVLENASATLDAGSQIGTTLLSASVSLGLGADGKVVIEKDVTGLTVAADSESRIVLDLNSEAWVTEENVDAGAVSETDVRQASRDFVGS